MRIFKRLFTTPDPEPLTDAQANSTVVAALTTWERERLALAASITQWYLESERPLVRPESVEVFRITDLVIVNVHAIPWQSGS